MARLKVSHLALHLVVSLGASGALAVGCGGDGPGDADGLDSDGPGDIGDLDSDLGGDLDGGGGAGGAGQDEVQIITSLPAGFTANVALEGEPPARGGWKLVGPLDESNLPDDAGCANVLHVVARDMKDSHPDFGSGSGDDLNIVTDTLGDDRKPVFGTSDSVESFGDWYNNVDGVNAPFIIDLWLEPVAGSFVFDSGSFFPLDEANTDEAEWNDRTEAVDGLQHRFLFTTELHTKFEYKGGETFTFRGDDDVFVYINGHLAVNLGGIHGPEEGSVDLDASAEALGITTGNVYTFDLFQAERKPVGSNFRIETTLDFTECGEILDNDVVR